MANEPPAGLVPYLEWRAGPALRGVLVYDEHGYEMRYLDTASRRQFEREIEAVVGWLRTDDSPLSDAVLPYGEYEAAVYVLERAILVVLPSDDGRGTMIALDPDAALQLTGFVEECLARV
ncbi:hypothetical protein ACFQH6_02320 [Halobacteriaceae archaeon GCM10025711]